VLTRRLAEPPFETALKMSKTWLAWGWRSQRADGFGLMRRCRAFAFALAKSRALHVIHRNDSVRRCDPFPVRRPRV